MTQTLNSTLSRVQIDSYYMIGIFDPTNLFFQDFLYTAAEVICSKKKELWWTKQDGFR